MFEIFRNYIENRIPLTENQWIKASVYLQSKNVRRGELLVSPGVKPEHGFFVMKGCLRNYVVKDGKEHIIQFAPENWWIGANHAVLPPETSIMYIDAVEDSRVALFDHNFMSILLNEIPEFMIMRQQLQEKAFRSLEKRVTHLLSSNAEERYTYFINTYPSLATRLPLKMIASYLGMAPQSLSRVRSKYAVKQ
jgi:CRP-like cAMP-binding protein